MRFIDEASIHVMSGRGGDGCASFRREKFVPFGGPDGGDGGRGGDVILVATSRRNTLLELRGRAVWKAKSGTHGKGSQRAGAYGEHIEVEVPVGTRVFDENSGEVLADLTEDGQRWVAAKGGKGGAGNIHFKTSTNRAPRKYTKGGDAVEKRLRLELMLMADVGLLGFPNAGKSTLISRISSARPRVADYPFTTLVPNLGVVDMGLEGSFVVADVPGLIQGAAEGAGLGHRFLRHVQRTRLLLHLVSLGPHDIDAAMAAEEDPALSAVNRYRAIRAELIAFDDDLADRPERVVLTKADIVDEETSKAAADALGELVGPEHVYVISAVTGAGVRELVGAIHRDLMDMLRE